MRRVVHLSDLHFGRTRPELHDPLVDIVNALRPDLVAVSGDLTQRARHHQFREARAFLDRLEAPWISVPGNHDVPLEHLPLRFLAPWKRYRRWIAEDLEPTFMDDEIAVIGLNTTDPFAQERGRMRRQSMARACRLLSRADARTQIVVAHHPFEHLPGDKKPLMLGATAAVENLSACGAQVVLSGHLHTWRAAPFTLPEGHRGVLQVQAGTGLSTRLRGEANDFNLLTIDGEGVLVERYVAEADSDAFERIASERFRRLGNGWDPAAPEPA